MKNWKRYVVVALLLVGAESALATCKQALSIGGKVYEITLPDGYCKSLGK